MVRTDHLKYVLTSSDEEAFFDLGSDPYELKNLIADPAQKDEIERHRKLLREWMMSVGEKRLPMAEVNEAKPKQEKKRAPLASPKKEAPMIPRSCLRHREKSMSINSRAGNRRNWRSISPRMGCSKKQSSGCYLVSRRELAGR